MKITIELEIEREDIVASVEIFNVIHKFADEVRVRSAPRLLAELIPRLAITNEAETVISDIQHLLEASSDTDEVFVALSATFIQHALALELIPRGGATLPFLSLLPRLPEPFRTKMKNDIVMKIIQYLNIGRTVDCNRGDILTYADAFATLVKLDFVKISGAVSTINALLKKPETKCAAFTMLGKTVELCISQIKEKCDAAPLNELRMLLQNPTINAEAFSYDVSYVESCLGWTRRPETFSPPSNIVSVSSYSFAASSNNYPSTNGNSNSFSTPTPPNSYNTVVSQPPVSNFIPSIVNSYVPSTGNTYTVPTVNSYTSQSMLSSPSVPYTTPASSYIPSSLNTNNNTTGQPITNSAGTHLSLAASSSLNYSSPAVVSPIAAQTSLPPTMVNSASQPLLPIPSVATTATLPPSSASSQTLAPQPNSNSAQDKTGLFLVLRHVGHTNTIFAVTYDEVNDNPITTGKDGAIITWSKDGKQKERLTIPRHYACSMDINQRFKSLYICGVSRDPDPNPSLVRYVVNDRGNWALAGIAEKKACKILSCVKALRSDKELFITGETDKIRDGVGFVRLYDIASSRSGFENILPILQYEEHKDIVTSLALHPTADDSFFSGSRDQVIKMWDRRSKKSAASFGTSKGGTIQAHEGMITCLDASGFKLASGGLDKRVAIWDLRAISNNNGHTHAIHRWDVDGNALLKVAIGPDSNNLAASTLRGLYMLDINTGKIVLADASSAPTKSAPGRYHDLKWSASVLYAVGDDCNVDGYMWK